MKQSKKLITVLAVLLICFVSKFSAQESDFSFITNYIFSEDSISGFDEQEASATALAKGAYGEEFKFYMYMQKRKFIIEKYNIKPTLSNQIGSLSYAPAKFVPNTNYSNKISSVLVSSGACNNEDFEDNAGVGGNQIGGVVNGWSLFSGSSSGGNDFCNPLATGPAAAAAYTLYNSPVVDNNMGVPNNVVSSYFDANSVTQPAGNCFIRINNNIAGASVVRLSKTYTVSASNALFRYAYRAVLENPFGHLCCEQPGFVIRVTITNTTTGTSTVLACPNITVAAGTACGPANPNFLTGPTNRLYNPNWIPASIDLSANIGNAVTLDCYAIDCSLTGHAGYVYFDALCSPMTIVGNGSPFQAGATNITIPTCGAAGATITAPPGLGPYTWASGAITIPANLAVPNTTNTTLLTNQSGTLSLIMNPPGSCAPITKVLTVTITPAPQALITTTQAGCNNPIACVSLTTAGSAAGSPNIVWFPAPGTLSTNSLLACNLPPGPGAVTVYDTFSCQIVNAYTINAVPPIPTFTLTNNTGSYSLTCINPTINLSVATNYTGGTANFNWINNTATFSSSLTNVNLTGAGNVGTYTVSLTDPVSACSTSQTFAIGQNAAIPVNTVSPGSQVITCNAGAATFTSSISSPTVNVTTSWFYNSATFPAGPSLVTNGTVSIGAPSSPGTVIVQTCNDVNGCCNTKTLTVTASTNVPTFNATSTTNFTLGCASPVDVTQLCINPTSAGAVNFAFLPPTSTLSVPIPTVLFSGTSCTTTAIPGTWTLVARDPNSNCQTPLPVVVLSNTVAPDVSASILTQTLTCVNPTVLAVGTSSTPNTNVSWLIPAPPNSLPTPTITVGFLGVPTGPNTNTNLPNFYAIYTAVATNTINQCKSTQTYSIYQNFYAPSNIGIGVSTPSNITCQNPCVSLSFTGATLSYTGGFSIPTNTWSAPPPLSNTSTLSTTSACVAGDYTLTVTDGKSGCAASKIYKVVEQLNTPVLANLPTYTLDCAATSSISAALIQISLTSTLSSWSLYIKEYPLNTAFSSINLTTPPNGLTVTPAGAITGSFTVDKTGSYGFVAKNLVTGCTEDGVFQVVAGGLNANFAPSTLTGFAPLNVTFSNLSSSSSTVSGTSSVTTIWNFGNGSVQTTTNAALTTSAIYNNPGTYTVTIVSLKGSCIDSAYKVIRVDIPSKLEIPNVFTPNGDGSNDVFFLKTSNLTEITALIFDRWGNKVYELTSNTGNIAWDGKNLEGKECATGTYFYVIKAKGKDDQSYEKKGNVTLFK